MRRHDSLRPSQNARMACKLDSHFAYERLNPKHQEIRLLTLQPGTLHDQPRCTIDTVSLLSEPDYFTLSYVWGDRQKRADILVNGYAFSVTQDLEQALRYLQCGTESRRLWVDAICID